MDSNYEAQKQFARQRLDARREEAARERLLRQGRPSSVHIFTQFFSKLFRRLRRQEAQKRAQDSAPARLATPRRGRG